MGAGQSTFAGTRTFLRRLGGNGGFVIPGLPIPKILLDKALHIGRLHIAHDDDRGVFRAIKSRVKFLAVLVLIGHVLDVLDEAHRGMLVGVSIERLFAQDLLQFVNRVGVILIVFAEHR